MQGTSTHRAEAPDVSAEEDATPLEEPRPPRERRENGRGVALRRIALTVYFAVLVWSCVTVGLPIADDRLFAFTIVGLLCASIGRPRRQFRDLLVDWVPFILIVLAYDYSRGWAQHAGFGVHFTPQIDADRLLFWGEVPTVWLQERLYDTLVIGPFATPAGPVQWWEVAFQLIYISHFLASFSFAAVLWVRKRAAFQAYARRLVTLSYLGFLTYVFFPAAPPWLAAAEGHLPAHVGRLGRGLDQIGLSVVADLVTEGAKTQNQVAAIPSLHLGFAALIVITLWRSVPPRWRPLLAAYPLTMSFVLVVTGEHYVVDLLLGFGYALGTHLAWTRIERWWRSRRPTERRQADTGGQARPVDASVRRRGGSSRRPTGGAPATAPPSLAGVGGDDRLAARAVPTRGPG